ncbi:MAG: toxin-antitoxin system HicB family antitoxin [Smithella sp.]
MNTATKSKSKIKKTFPLEIEESLHKALKHKAIESDMSLHAYIIDTLVSRVNEQNSPYNVDDKTEESRKKK